MGCVVYTTATNTRRDRPVYVCVLGRANNTAYYVHVLSVRPTSYNILTKPRQNIAHVQYVCMFCHCMSLTTACVYLLSVSIREKGHC